MVHVMEDRGERDAEKKRRCHGQEETDVWSRKSFTYRQVQGIKTGAHFLQTENIPGLQWPPYSLPVNIHQVCRALVEEWDDIPPASINYLIHCMWRRCTGLWNAHSGNTYWKGNFEQWRHLSFIYSHWFEFYLILFPFTCILSSALLCT